MEQVRLAGAGVTDEAQRLAGLDPRAFGQGVDERGVDERVGVEVECVETFGAGEAGLAHEPGLASFLSFAALDGQQLDEEAFVAGLLTCRGGGQVVVALADGGQPQDAAGLLDRGVGGGVGELVAPLDGGHDASRCVRRASSWS
jgi:hypothetical protein